MNLKNSCGGQCQRIFPERTLKGQSVKIQRITSCSQQSSWLYLCCFLFSHSYTPTNPILCRCFAFLKLGGAQGRGGFAPALLVGARMPELTLHLQGCIYDFNIFLHVFFLLYIMNCRFSFKSQRKGNSGRVLILAYHSTLL